MSADPSRAPYVTAQAAVLVLAAALAWLEVILRSPGMAAMPGTPGLPVFVFMWVLMMAAMMLPSVAPVASVYAQTVRAKRWPRLVLFAGGYLTAWAGVGVPAFGFIQLVQRIVDGHPRETPLIAAGIFIMCGVYQLTPLKHRCLASLPLAALAAASVRVLSWCAARPAGPGPSWSLLRGVLLGAHGGACRAGVMNLAVIVGLSGVALVEKLWAGGEAFSRAVGVAALVLAVAVIWMPDLAPGLHMSGTMQMAR